MGEDSASKVDSIEVNGYTFLYGMRDNPVVNACGDGAFARAALILPPEKPLREFSPSCEELIKKARADMKSVEPIELLKLVDMDDYRDDEFTHPIQRDVAQEVHPRLASRFYTLKCYGFPVSEECPLRKSGVKPGVYLRAYCHKYTVAIYVMCTAMPFSTRSSASRRVARLSKGGPVLAICDAGAVGCQAHEECPHRRVHARSQNCEGACYNKKRCRGATDADRVMDKMTENRVNKDG